MAKRQTTHLTVGVTASLAGLAAFLFMACGLSNGGESTRTYEVHYVWDNGIKSLQIINGKTGAEETDRNWRRKVRAVAEEELPRIVKSAGLTRAVGRFYVDTVGQEARYLPQWGSPTNPDLATDPDITPLMSALDRGDAAKARELIAAGANVNAADQRGWTALMRAAARGDTATVHALLAAGAQVNARNKDGETALFGAAFLARLEVVKELVRRGADVNATSKHGVTPLIEASQRDPAVVEFLIKKGADVNAKTTTGDTALIFAARAGNAQMAAVLIRGGAEVNAKNATGETALSIAQRERCTPLVDALTNAGARD